MAQGRMGGKIHVYTGNGKGKTTSALSAVVRETSAGGRVYLAQFLKLGDYSEIKAIRKLSGSLFIEQFGYAHYNFIFGRPKPVDIVAARKGLERVHETIASGRYDLAVLDEANVAIKYNLFPVADLVDICRGKPRGMDLVITGRAAPPEIIAMADLAVEMVEVAHYAQKGVAARPGIEK